VGPPALGRGGQPPGRPPQQRVPEPQAAAVADQHPALLGLVQGGVRIHAVLTQGNDRRGGGLLRIGGAQQDGSPCRGRQPSQQRLVHQLQAVAHRQEVREGGRAQPLGRGKPPGHLLEGQRIATGALNQPGHHPIGQAVGQQPGGLAWHQSGQGDHREALQRRRRSRPGPHRQQEGHRVVVQPPGGEQQGRRRLPVHPLQVVDQHQHRCPLGCGGQQRQGGGGDQIAVPGRPGRPPAQRRRQGLGLGRRQVDQPFAHRTEQLQQGRVAQGGFRLHPPGPEAGEPAGQLLGRLQQGRLADAGLARDHQRARHPAAGRLQQG
jgi:hypothetical protein